MAINHTPGPWRVGDAGATVFGPKTDRPSPLTIANLAAQPNYKANARLIAAAPDLLRVLTELHQYAEQLMYKVGTKKCDPLLIWAVSNAELLINKLEE